MNKSILVQIPPGKSQSYPILIASGLLSDHTWFPKNNNIVIITDHAVKKKYGNALATRLKKQSKQVLLLSFPAGETFKNAKTKQYLEEKMLQQHYNRDTLVIALGGGVVGDMAGFIAATYMRGIAFLQIPTTLLAMVDSSVGGKTGIDTPQGKNLIGAFWQPTAVISDLDCLKTLPKKQLINGLIEALKMFLTCDSKSFHFACQNLDNILAYDPIILTQIIYNAVKIKAHIVQQDEKEANLRMILNFGHTIGHALEFMADYKIHHGYAVGYGILLEAKIAEQLGWLASKDFNLIAETFSELGIKGIHFKKYNIKKIIQATRIDKKSLHDKARFTLLTQIGKVHKENGLIVHPVDETVVHQAYLELTEPSYAR